MSNNNNAQLNKDINLLVTVDKKYVDTKIVLDERTVDGHYYAQFLQAFRYIFQHPEILETPPSKVVEDVF